LLLIQGTHPKIVQARLGHSRVSQTLDTYSHILGGMDTEAANMLDATLTAKPAAKTAAGA
jgi:integrase